MSDNKGYKINQVVWCIDSSWMVPFKTMIRSVSAKKQGENDKSYRVWDLGNGVLDVSYGTPHAPNNEPMIFPTAKEAYEFCLESLAKWYADNLAKLNKAYEECK